MDLLDRYTLAPPGKYDWTVHTWWWCSQSAPLLWILVTIVFHYWHIFKLFYMADEDLVSRQIVRVAWIMKHYYAVTMPVLTVKNQVRVRQSKMVSFRWRQKVCGDDDDTMASGIPFQTWAVAVGKAWLPTVDNLICSWYEIMLTSWVVTVFIGCFTRSIPWGLACWIGVCIHTLSFRDQTFVIFTLHSCEFSFIALKSYWLFYITLQYFGLTVICSGQVFILMYLK